MHHHGRRVVDAAELRQVDSDHPLWEWSQDSVGTLPSGDSTIYGPYTTDFEEPGLYSVSFRIKAIGLSKPREIIDDFILLELDVSSTTVKYTPMQTGVTAFGALRKVARRFIRISDLAIGGWLRFDLKFYSDGEGNWEYRILGYDGLGGRADNIGRLGTNVRLLFDSIAIRRLKRLRLPWD